MKIQAVTALCWAAWSSAAHIKRDTPANKQFDQAVKVLEQVAPNIKPAIVNLKPKLRPNSIRKQLRFGPHTIPKSKAAVSSSGGHMEHGSAPATSTAPKNWADMTISEAISSLTGQPPPLGQFRVTLGQLWRSVSSLWTGDYVGPLKEIMGATQDPNGWSLQRTFKAKDLCQGCTILSVKSDVVFEDGTRADISKGIYLHHHASVNMGMHATVNWLSPCTTNQSTFNGFKLQDYLPRETVGPIQVLALGAVDEYTQYYTSKDGKVNSGHPVNEDDTFFMMTEAVNYGQTDQKIYVQLDVEYVDGKPEKETTFTSQSFTGCDPMWGFTGNGTAGSIISDTFDVYYPGTIVNARGHMHDGGTSLDLLLNDKMVCSSRAVYATKMKMDGKEWTTLSQMTDCTEPFIVKKGDKIRMVVNFDEVAHPKRDSHGQEQEEMGWMYFTFIPA